MAKKSMIAKAQRRPKFQVRQVTAAESAGGPAVTCAVFRCAASASGSMLMKGRFPE